MDSWLRAGALTGLILWTSALCAAALLHARLGGELRPARWTYRWVSLPGAFVALLSLIGQFHRAPLIARERPVQIFVALLLCLLAADALIARSLGRSPRPRLSLALGALAAALGLALVWLWGWRS